MTSARSFFVLVGRTLNVLISSPFRGKEFVRQLFFVANGSLPIVLFCVGFAAIVTILEASFHMKIVIQNDSMVPGFASLLILRELGPVVTALLLTSRVGAGFTAEVGLMKTTEQIDALRMLGIDPVQYLVVPRFVATVTGTFLLALLASMTCLLGAMVVSDLHLGYSPSMFLSSMRVFAGFRDLLLAGVKGAAFGAVIPLVSCHFGFLCEEGAEGVGKATTQSVVVSSVSIIVLDFVLSSVFSYV